MLHPESETTHGQMRLKSEMQVSTRERHTDCLHLACVEEMGMCTLQNDTQTFLGVTVDISEVAAAIRQSCHFRKCSGLPFTFRKS